MTTSILLVPYIFFVGIFAIFSGFSIYHMIKFSLVNKMSFIATFLFVTMTIIIFLTTWIYASTVDWTRPLFESQQFRFDNKDLRF